MVDIYFDYYEDGDIWLAFANNCLAGCVMGDNFEMFIFPPKTNCKYKLDEQLLTLEDAKNYLATYLVETTVDEPVTLQMHANRLYATTEPRIETDGDLEEDV